MNFLKGKKTYIVAIVAVLMAGLPAAGVAIPAWVAPMLAGLGLYTLRDAIKNK